METEMQTEVKPAEEIKQKVIKPFIGGNVTAEEKEKFLAYAKANGLNASQLLKKLISQL